MKPLYILNGPNLNFLHKREPEIYGGISLEVIQSACLKMAQEKGLSIVFRQTNHEGILIDWVQEAEEEASALLINAGGLTHTSISLMDALLAVKVPVIEVHISSPKRREDFRHLSYVSQAAHGIVAGFGINSYILAIQAAQDLIIDK